MTAFESISDIYLFFFFNQSLSFEQSWKEETKY